MASMNHRRRFYRDVGGVRTVNAATAVELAEVDSEAELSGLVCSGAISAPIHSNTGPRYIARELVAFAFKQRHTE
jgi:hypothetical protein